MKKIKDHYFHKAKKDGYVARSVYKIEEIDNKHRIILTGNKVLDLGCSPGSWLQYASRKVGNTGHVLGIDVQPVKISLPRNVKVIQTDIFEITKQFTFEAAHYFPNMPEGHIYRKIHGHSFVVEVTFYGKKNKENQNGI